MLPYALRGPAPGIPDQRRPRLADCILWIMFAHMCVRPGIIDQIRSSVCMQALRPTRGNIEDVMKVLARRHGHVASCMESGKRRWRQGDVFGLAPTQALGVTNCGTHNLQRQLLVFNKLRGIVEQLALLDRNPAFSDIVDCIGKARVPC